MRKNHFSGDEEELDDNTDKSPNDALNVLISTQPVDAHTLLEIGQELQAEQQGQWWTAQIVRFLDDERVRVHYVGWETAWDESVPRSRLRVPRETPIVVRVACENSQTHEGHFLGSHSGYVILQRPDGAQILIDSQRIISLEIAP